MASIFWNVQGHLLNDYLEKGKTTNSEYYMALLDQLNKEEKLPQMQKKKVLFRQVPQVYENVDRWIPRGVSFQRPRHRLIAVASLGRLPRNRSIPVWFTRYPRTALSDRWRSLGITSLMNIGGIRYVHIHSYIGHHDQACVLACKIQCISKFHEIKLKS
ncbi:hypothetical protein TNCV_717741 [Trichonephila clavipes]|nr:hypothetical protein TNCV_717741 [Trichonephila clavipes]